MTLGACGERLVVDGGKTDLPPPAHSLFSPVAMPARPVSGAGDARLKLDQMGSALKVCNAQLGKAEDWYEGVRKTFQRGR